MLCWAHFHFLNNCSLGMLYSLLHRNKATSFCTSRLFYCLRHRWCCFTPVLLQAYVKACPRPSGLTSDWAIRFWKDILNSGNYQGCLWRVTKEYLWDLLRWSEDLWHWRLHLACSCNHDRAERCTIYWRCNPPIEHGHRPWPWQGSWGNLFCGSFPLKDQLLLPNT